GVGTYQFTVELGGPNYVNNSFVINIEVLPVSSSHDDPILRQAEYGNTPIDNSTKPPYYQVYYGCDVDVEILYKNGITSNPITDADGMLIFNSNYYFDSNPADGIYRFNITFSTVGVGTYQFTVELGGPNYVNNSFVINVEVLACPTIIENISYTNAHGPLGYNPTENKYTAKIDSDITILLRFNNTKGNIGIEGATAKLINGSDMSEHFNTTVVGGFVTFYIYAADYTSGQIITYTINITKANYESSEITFKIEFVDIQTDAYIYIVNQTIGGNITPYGTPDMYDIFRGKNTTIIAYYNNTDDNEGISGANATLIINGKEYNTTTNSSGYAIWTVITYNMTVGIYDCQIQFSNTSCVEQNLIFKLNLTLIKSSGELKAIYQPDHVPWGVDNLTFSAGKYNAWMGYTISINVTYEDVTYGGFINDGLGTLWFGSNVYYHTSVLNGVYHFENIAVPTISGDYILQIEINKTHYENASFSFTISVNPLPTIINEDLIAHNISGTIKPLQKVGNDHIAYNYFNKIIVRLIYYDTNNSVIIGSSAISWMQIGLGPQIVGTWNASASAFYWIINTSDLSMGLNSILFHFSFTNYETKEVTYNISLQRLDVTPEFISISQFGNIIVENAGGYKVYASGSDYITVIYSFKENVYNYDAEGLPVLLTIDGTTISVSNSTNKTGDVVFSFLMTEVPASYTIDIVWGSGSTSFNIGLLNNNLTLILDYRQTQYSQLSVNDGHELNKTGMEFEYAYFENAINISVYFEDIYLSTPINNGIMNLTIINGKSYIDTTATNGFYSIVIPANDVNETKIQLLLNLNATYYYNQSIMFNISLKNKAEVKITLINPPVSVEPGSEIVLNIYVQYKFEDDSDWSNYSGCELSIIVDFGQGISQFTDSVTTNAQGLVSIIISIPNNAKQFIITINSAGDYNIQNGFAQNTLKIKEVTPPGIDWWIYILIVVIIGALSVTILRKRSSKPKEVVGKKAKKKKVPTEYPQELLPEEKEKVIAEEEGTEEKLPEETKAKKEPETKKKKKPKIITKAEVKEEIPKKEEIREKPIKESTEIIDTKETKETKDIKEMKEAKSPAKTKEESAKKKSAKKISKKKKLVVKTKGVTLEKPLEQQIEDVIIQILNEQKISKKLILRDKIAEILRSEKIDVTEEKILEIIDNLTENKKIGYDRSAKSWRVL
ncbi:MAG: hypothetical protein ACTSRZ_18085, partial [Promethearchaeota archaeon]